MMATKVEAEVVQVPLEYLVLAPENTRQEPDPETLEALKASIREQGLLQNLVGYEAGERVLVVAGGHRLRALQALAAEGHPVGEVPVRLVAREKALLLSVAENLQRKDLSPLEEAEAVASLERAGLSPEAIARELGRSLTFVRGRLQVAKGLSKSWRAALHARAIPFALAAELAELPEEEQESLFERHGTALRPETVRNLRLKDKVPVRRFLPGVRERYLEGGGALEADLEGNEYALDRALALGLQAEAARALAERLKAELHVDLPLERITQAPPGQGRNLVVLRSDTLEVRTFLGVRLSGEKEEAAEARPEAAERTEGKAPPQKEASTPGPARPAPAAPGTASAPQGPRVTLQGAAERVALEVRAARERALQDPRYARAALVLAVEETFLSLAYTGRSGHFTYRDADRIYDGHLKLETKRWEELSGNKALKGRLRELLPGPNPTVEDLLALPEEVLEEAFRTAVALLIALPRAKEPPSPTLGMADPEHLHQFNGEALEAALREVKVAFSPRADKKEKAALLLSKKEASYPKALREAKTKRE